MKSRPTIVWDLDDVLNTFTEQWLALRWKSGHPECLLTFDDLHSHPPLRELGITYEIYLESIDNFRLDFTGRVWHRPRAALLGWFKCTGHRFHHAVLTACPLFAVAPAAAMVFTHFGQWVREFHTVPSPRPGDSLPQFGESKADVLQRLRPDFFVDDSAENIAAAQAIGVRGLLFPQPWNPSAMPLPALLAEIEKSL